MSLSLRFILPLVLALAAMAYGVLPLVDQLTLRWFVRDLDIRAGLIANAVQEPWQERLRIGQKTGRSSISAASPRMSACSAPAIVPAREA